MFADSAKIFIKSGKGGDGHVSFRRELFVAAGGPDGGDGGRGGDIIFEVDKGLNTLGEFRHTRKYVAESGEEGGKRLCHGKDGADLIIKVPEGTIIKDDTSGKIIADMSGDNMKVTILRGGRGGKGNKNYATATMQVPKYAQPGQQAKELWVRLELKVIADVGLVGFPNVGKSTLLSVTSNAHPKIANYHFTTLYPNLGVIYVADGVSFVMADIPGIIEGAADGVGLGHDFLRHIDRCRLLVHILDAAGSEGRDPIEDFEIINRELEKFDPELAKRPQIVVANKVDLADDEQLERLRSYFTDKGYEYHTMCAPICEGTSELVSAIWNRLSTLPPIKRYETESIPLEMFEKQNDKGFTIRVEDGVYFVEAPWLLKILQRTDLDDYESLQYFQRVLTSSGIIDALRERGINEGDTVSIYELEFDFVN